MPCRRSCWQVGIAAAILIAASGCEPAGISHAPAKIQSPSSPARDSTVRVTKQIELLNLEGAAVDPFVDAADAPIVFLFMRTDCPIGNRYAPTIKELVEQFFSQGVTFYDVYADAVESVEMIRKHRKEYGYTEEALRDLEHVLVELTGVEVTPEAAVFVDHVMVYRGRIDNRFVDFGKTRTVTTTHDLHDVLQTVVAHQPVTTAWPKAVGCPIPAMK